MLHIYINIYIIKIYNFLNINLYENFNERIMDNIVNRYSYIYHCRCRALNIH